MNQQVLDALRADRVVDISTTGRKTGRLHRIEIWCWTLEDGSHAISGNPGSPRDWYANLRAIPDFTVHVKNGAQADLKARALTVDDSAERRRIITEIARRLDLEHEIEARVASSPLVKVVFDG